MERERNLLDVNRGRPMKNLSENRGALSERREMCSERIEMAVLI